MEPFTQLQHNRYISTVWRTGRRSYKKKGRAVTREDLVYHSDDHIIDGYLVVRAWLRAEFGYEPADHLQMLEVDSDIFVVPTKLPMWGKSFVFKKLG